MGKFNETKWRQCLQREMEMAPLDVVRGYAQDGLTLRLAAATLECPVPFLRSLADAAGIKFRSETAIERASSPTRAETVRAYHARAGRMPVGELANLTGLDRKTIERRQELGLPKHRLVASDWPGRKGGRKPVQSPKSVNDLEARDRAAIKISRRIKLKAPRARVWADGFRSPSKGWRI